MNILTAGYKILTPISDGGINELKQIERIGRVCYKSEDKITEDGESAKRFVKMLIDNHHEAMIEHSTLSVLFTCDRGCCYDKNTKVLTNSGWKYFYELNEEDLVLTLDDNNNTLYIKPNKLIKKYYDGLLDYWHSTQIDLMVTPNHNMWLFDYNKRREESKDWKFIESQNATNKAYKFSKSANPINNIGYTKYKIDGNFVNRGFWKQEYEPLTFEANFFFELIGLWITDGCISYGKNGCGNRIVITQVKPKIRKRIEYLLNKLQIKYCKQGKDFRINCPQLFAWISKNFLIPNNANKTYYISIPRWMFNELSSENLKYLLKGIIEGDGAPHTKGKGYQIYTASKKFAEDLVELLLHIGLCGNIYIVKPRKRLFQNGREVICKEQYIVSITVTKDTLFREKGKTGKAKVQYSDYVYCVELPKYHRLYVMRNGKSCWCGNSHEMVRHRIASFAQESTRYVNYAKDKFGNEIGVIDIINGINLDSKMKNFDADNIGAIYSEWLKAMEDAEKHYMEMIELGATPQIARSVLPNSTKTNITITANYREWRTFFKLRTAKDAHPQIREVAIPLCRELQQRIPVVFDDIDLPDA